MTKPLLKISNLTIAFAGKSVVRDVNLEVPRGGSLGIAGESGSGKSLTAFAAIGLLPCTADVAGRISFDGIDMVRSDDRTLRALRGDRIGMIFQEPMTALNPMHRARDQVAETILVHGGTDRAAARERASEHLGRVGIGAALADRFPHQLSGGERQRVMIAAATVLDPELVIADEPTTALDVIRQREVLDLLHELTIERGSSLLFITHDLAVMAEMADRIVVLREGEAVEQFDTVDMRSPGRAPYTRSLIEGASAHRNYSAPPLRTAEPILRVERVSKTYRRGFFRPERTHAVRDLDLDVGTGEIIGLVGPSGCGKSTLARMVLALEKPSAGRIEFGGVDLSKLSSGKATAFRSEAQIVFQDPNGSFDPRRRVGWSIGEPFDALVGGTPAERKRHVDRALERVSLSPAVADRYPHEFSGGQRQRLAIARAIVIEPKLIVADEPVSALDVTVRGRILDTFRDLNERLGIAIVFVSHDLDVVRSIAHRIAVMEAGRIVEVGVPEELFAHPQHSMTKRLLAAKPDLDRALAARQRSTATATRTDSTMQARV